MRGILLVVALLAVMPLAAAQAPPCATLTVSHIPPADFDAGALQAVEVQVANDGALAAVDAVVRANVATAGWTVDPAEQTVRIAAGGSAAVLFNVTAPATAGSEATLDVVASGTCVGTGPIVIPGGQGPAVPESTDSVPLTVAAASGFQLPTQLSEIPPEYLIGALAALALVIGAILAARRRRGGFVAKCPEPEKAVKSGRGASFPLEVVNRGRAPDTALFDVGEVPAGWTAFMAIPELALAPGESRTLWLMVRAPGDAAVGSAAVVPIVVRSKSHPRIESRVAVRAEVKAETDEGGGGGASVEATRVG